MSTIGERLRERREFRGWSQSELGRRMVAAGQLQYCQTVVSRTEKGQREPRLSEAVILAGVLGMDLGGITGAEWRDRYWDGYRDGLDAAKKAIDGI